MRSKDVEGGVTWTRVETDARAAARTLDFFRRLEHLAFFPREIRASASENGGGDRENKKKTRALSVKGKGRGGEVKKIKGDLNMSLSKLSVGAVSVKAVPSLISSDIGLGKGVGVIPNLPGAVSPLEKLKKQLGEIESKYDLYGKNAYGLPSGLGLDKAAYNGMTDDEITEYVKAKLTEEYNVRVAALNGDAARAESDLNSKKTGLSEAARETDKALDAAYGDAAVKVSNDALKRGLARSSIIVNKLTELEKQKTDAKSGLSAKLFDSLAALDGEIDALETKRLKALDDIDLARAARIQTEIADMKAERERRMDEVLKYNNSLREKEANYALNYAKTDSSLDGDLYDREANDLKNGLSAALSAEIARNKYEAIGEFLLSVDKNDALEYLKNNEAYFTAQVGTAYYKRLVSDTRARG